MRARELTLNKSDNMANAPQLQPAGGYQHDAGALAAEMFNRMVCGRPGLHKMYTNLNEARWC